jgi:hypothetical protein
MDGPKPPMLRKEEFSRQQSMGLRESMAAALVRLLQSTTFIGPLGRGVIKLETAFMEWPSYPDEYMGPAACVLPGEGKDVEGRLLPNLLEDTWEPKGQPGWGLYVLGEYESEFTIRVRAASAVERDAIIAGVEQLFVQDPGQMLIAPDKGNRYGTLLDLPEYFQSQARFGLKSTTVLDDEESAMREQREVAFIVSGQAKKLRVGLVQPFTLKLKVDPDATYIVDPDNQLED